MEDKFKSTEFFISDNIEESLGSKTVVQPMAGKNLADVDCVFCGQCKAVCPTGALTVRNEVNAVWDEINNPNKKVDVQVAPAKSSTPCAFAYSLSLFVKATIDA